MAINLLSNCRKSKKIFLWSVFSFSRVQIDYLMCSYGNKRKIILYIYIYKI